MRRRSRLLPTLVVIGVAVVVIAVLIGGALRIGRSSSPYHRAVDRSYGMVADEFVRQSNFLGRSIATFIANVGIYTRTSLAETLAGFTRQAHTVAADVVSIESPAPSRGAGALLTSVVTERAGAVRTMCTAIDSLLLISAPTAVGTRSQPAVMTNAITKASAESALARAATEVSAADTRYQNARNALGEAPGGFWMTGSSWTKGTSSWSVETLDSMVGALAGAPDLQPFFDVVLVSGATRLMPSALPTTVGVVTIPPTHSLSVGVVVAEEGDLPTPPVEVKVALATLITGHTIERHRRVALSPGGSRNIEFARLAVRPGITYVVTLLVVPPAGQTLSAGTPQSFSVSVAPTTPTTTSPLGT